jgi:hypothetical protein
MGGGEGEVPLFSFFFKFIALTPCGFGLLLGYLFINFPSFFSFSQKHTPENTGQKNILS